VVRIVVVVMVVTSAEVFETTSPILKYPSSFQGREREREGGEEEVGGEESEVESEDKNEDDRHR
jgi:hypothetical protein